MEKSRLNWFSWTETLGGFHTKALGYSLGSVYTAWSVKEEKEEEKKPHNAAFISIWVKRIAELDIL